MEELFFYFPVNPMTKDNIKITGKHGKPYLPEAFKEWERDVATFALKQMVEQGFEEPIKEKLMVTLLNFRFDKAVSKKDFFNYTKSLFDALNGIVYKDDSQIVGFNGCGEKCISEKPCIELNLKTVE